MQKGSHLLARPLRLGCIGYPVLEVVDHPLVQVEFHRYTRSVERLIEPDEATEQDLLQTALNECRRKAFGEVAYTGDAYGFF